MVLSAGTSHMPSSQELAGLGLRLPPQPSHPLSEYLEEGVSPGAPGTGPAVALAAAGAVGEAGWLPGYAAAPGTQSHPCWPASPWGPSHDIPGGAAGGLGLPEQLPAMFNLSGACCVLLWFGSRVESRDLTQSLCVCQNSVSVYAFWSRQIPHTVLRVVV